jgi:hypothetical protein
MALSVIGLRAVRLETMDIPIYRGALILIQAVFMLIGYLLGRLHGV